VQRSSFLDLLPHRFKASFGERNHAIFFALAVANENLSALKVDVFDSQPANFQQSHPGAVKQFAVESRQTALRTSVKDPSNFRK
jgi:hypothetical protein